MYHHSSYFQTKLLPTTFVVMNALDLSSSCFMLVSLLLSNSLTIILLKYKSSIIYNHRDILTYLNTALIITMNICLNQQSGTFLLKMLYGPLPWQFAFVARTVFMACLFLIHGIVFAINVLRMLLIFKVGTAGTRVGPSGRY